MHVFQVPIVLHVFVSKIFQNVVLVDKHRHITFRWSLSIFLFGRFIQEFFNRCLQAPNNRNKQIRSLIFHAERLGMFIEGIHDDFLTETMHPVMHSCSNPHHCSHQQRNSVENILCFEVPQVYHFQACLFYFPDVYMCFNHSTE